MELERFLWFIVPIGLSIVGGYMIIRPAEIALQNRDHAGDTSPPTAAEIRFTRGLGVVVLVGGIYGLYRMLGGTWGAGGPGDDVDFDSLVELLHALALDLTNVS
jgi:hypothetical protein